MRQLLNDRQRFEDDIHEAMQEDKSQQDARDSDKVTDTEMLPLLKRLYHEASSIEDTSDELYDYYSDRNNRSIEGSDDESRCTILGQQQKDVLIVGVIEIVCIVKIVTILQ